MRSFEEKRGKKELHTYRKRRMELQMDTERPATAFETSLEAKASISHLRGSKSPILELLFA